MARARLLYKNLTKSDKYNNLYGHDLGELAQNIYMIYYSFADDWGHLQFDSRYVKRECLPDSNRNIEDVKAAMMLLCEVGLWKLYGIEGAYYVYITRFEVFQRDGIRHRRRGEFPDECGDVPQREVENKKPVKIDVCLSNSAFIRSKSTHYVILRNNSKYPD